MKCAVITPIASGDELFALDAADSVRQAVAAGQGPFHEVVHLTLPDPGSDPAQARNAGVKLAGEAGADWIFFLEARDVLCPDVFKHIADKLGCYDAIWGGIHELAADEASASLRAGQLLEIARTEQILANDPLNTLGSGHFVRTAVALATPFDPQAGAGAEFDYYLRLWRQNRCIKIAESLVYERMPAGGDHGAQSRDERRAAIERVVCSHCAALDFGAEFTYRDEQFRFAVVNPFDLIHGTLLKGRFFELPELNFIEAWVGPAAAIVEVGAYVGNHVVYYERFMQPQSVIVLEPNPDAIALLRRNMKANRVRCADLSLLGIGVAANAAKYDLVCESNANGGATRLVPAAGGAIKSAPLDGLLTGKVDFIKIDVEGMEFEVLQGAARVIRESQARMMIEVMRPQIPRFQAWLKEHRYREARRFDNVHAVNFCVEPAHA